MGYLRIDKDLCDDWRVFALTGDLLDAWVVMGLPSELREAFRGNARNALLGALQRYWNYADTHLGHGDRLRLALHGVGQVTQLPLSVLEKFPPEWLTVHADGTIELPGYSEKNALMDRDMRREATRIRVRKYRARMQRSEERKRNARVPKGNTPRVTKSLHPTRLPDPDPKTGTVARDAGNGASLASALGHLATPKKKPAMSEAERRETIERRRKEAAEIAERAKP